MVTFRDDPDAQMTATELPPIRGLLPSTLIDWPGRIAAIIFLPLCNLRCGYCHAGDLLEPNADERIPFEEFRDYLREKKDWIDGVVICGGEPTLHASLPALCVRLHESGVGVKLDTNGTHPEVVEALLAEGLIDAVSMDIKTTLNDRMRELARREVDPAAIERSIDLLRAASLPAPTGTDSGGAVEVEFRTTCCPTFVDAEVVRWIARRIGPTDDRPGSVHVLQRFQPEHCLDPAFREIVPYTPPQMEALLAAGREINPNTRLRTT